MRKLKNYLEYKKKLLDFAIALNISVTYTIHLDEGSAVNNKHILLDVNLSNSDEIAVLLHEIGHVLDDLSFTIEQYNKISRAYNKIYTDTYTEQHKETVIDREKAAWKYGRNLASQLNIKLGKWFDNKQKACIQSYKE